MGGIIMDGKKRKCRLLAGNLSLMKDKPTQLPQINTELKEMREGKKKKKRKEQTTDRITKTIVDIVKEITP